MAKRDFSVIAILLFVRKNQFTESHERMKTSEKDHEKKKIVVCRSRSKPINNQKKIGMREWCLSFDRSTKSAQTSCHRARDKNSFTVLTNLWEKRLQLSANARQIRVDRSWFDMTGEENNIKRQRVRSGSDRQAVQVAERNLYKN